MITLYGIPNCDTVKKARTWLTQHDIAYQFHDFKKQGISPEALKTWANAVGWEKLLNRQGTTWRKLDATTQATVVDADSAIALMLNQTSLIKRPVVEWALNQVKNTISVGFKAEDWTGAIEILSFKG